jgi:hypothetical protein
MEIREETAFSATRYFLAGTVIMRCRQFAGLIIIEEVIKVC